MFFAPKSMHTLINQQGLDCFTSMPAWVDDLGDFKLTPAEWLVLSDFEIILQVHSTSHDTQY